MADKTIRVTMTGPAEIVDASLDSFARLHGWNEGIQGLTKETVAQAALFKFILESVRTWNIQQAQTQAAQLAAAAVDAQVPQTTLELVVEEE